MDPREKRILRLREIRTREVHRAASEVHAVANELCVVEEALKEAALALTRAERERRELGTRSHLAQDYTELETWLDTLSIRFQTAQKVVREVRGRLERHRKVLAQKRMEEKQAGLLLERLGERRLQEERKRERNREDEFARLRSPLKE